MSQPCHADLVVVGARAAGAATAMLAARAGLSVILLDREPPGTDTLSTHALMRGGVVQLHRWGLLERIVASGAPAIRQTTFHYTDSDLTLAIKPAAGVDALYAPRRTVLDPILVTAACEAGAAVHHGITVTGVHRDHDRVTGVQVLDRYRRTSAIGAQLVIGADGRRSTVARLVDAPATHAARHTSSFVYAYFADLDATGYEWAYRPAGTAGFIPTNHGLTCVFAGHLPERIGRGGAAVLHDVVEQASPQLAERLRAARRVSPARTFTGRPGLLRRPWGPGWALVGDAGSWKDPISAHGLTDALRDAEFLAIAATAALGGHAPEAEAFADYERVRDRLTLPILWLGDEIAAMQWDDARISELLLGLKAAMDAELETICDLDRIRAGARAESAAG